MILNEDIFEDEIVTSESEPDTSNGVAELLINAINDEWEAISTYNSMITTLTDLGGYESMIEVLNDIAQEENKHVGQLQECLKSVSENTEKIDDGAKEGKEQLEGESPVEEVSTEPVEESLKESVAKRYSKYVEDMYRAGDGTYMIDLKEPYSTPYNTNYINCATKRAAIDELEDYIDSWENTLTEDLENTISYEGFDIQPLKMKLYYKDNEPSDMISYIILSSTKLSNDMRLPLYCENEDGEVQNFHTVEEAKSWIDTYKDKFHLDIQHGDEIHAVIDEDIK